MKKALLSISIISALFSCDNKTTREQGHAAEDTAATKMIETPKNEVSVVNGDTMKFPVKNGIKLSVLESVPEFMDAQLTQNKPGENSKVKTGNVTFTFEVKNYKLGSQTEKGGCGQCSNSDKGQHIHLILNNNPYIALYSPEHTEKLEPGNYVELAFLSRSYHVSIKQPDAYVLRQFTVGDVKPAKVDLNAPHMFYSRPKGDYIGKDIEKVVLDFFLVNTDLSKDGNKVKATINGNPFTITKWAPYIIEGLKEGENTVKLELLDKSGKLIQSPYNPVERKINLKQSAS